MSKRKPSPASPPSAQTAQPASPNFRPFEEKLKKLAEAARAASKEAQKKATDPKGTAAKASAHAPSTQPQRNDVAPRPRSVDTPTAKNAPEDPFFFRRLMSGVVPLKDDTRGRVTDTPIVKSPSSKQTIQTVAALKSEDDAVRDHLMNLVEGASRFEVTDDGTTLEGRRLDLDHGTWKRVRRGELPVDARLDLHGKSADQARELLEGFLREKRMRRERMVLVIHGRGDHSPGGVGVLRGEISAWLSQGRASQYVAAFATARPEDGGSGALYVLLRV